MPASRARPALLTVTALLAAGGTATSHEKADAPTGAIVGSFSRPLPVTDPEFQFHSACAIEARDPRTRKKTVIRAPRGRDDCFRAPQVSPDGGHVLYWAEIPGQPNELRVIAIDGRGEQSVARGDHDHQRAELLEAWSPDGTLIALGARKKAAHWILLDPVERRIWKMSPCVREVRYDVFVWSADGHRIFTVADPYQGDPDASPRLVTCDLDGTRRDPGPRFVGLLSTIALSPEARSAFVVDNQQPIISSLEDGQFSKLWTGAQVRLPFWSPDGAWLGALVSRNNDVGRITLYSLKANSSVQLGDEEAYELSWAPPPHPPSVDARAIVRRALGPGEQVALPLVIDLR